MKKFIEVVFAGILLLLFVSCGSSSGQPIVDDDPVVDENIAVKDYSKRGSFNPKRYPDEGLTQDDYVVYYPENNITADMPVVLFLEGGGSEPKIDHYRGIMKYMASHGYFVIGGETGEGYDVRNYVHIFEKAIDTAKSVHGLKIKKLAVMGHSQGGGQAFYTMKYFQDPAHGGYGSDGSLVLSIDGWFAFDMNRSDLEALQGDVAFLQMNGLVGTGTDPRVHLSIWNLASQTERKFLTLPEEEHGYVAGSFESVLGKTDLIHIVGALCDDVFTHASSGYASIDDTYKSTFDQIKNILKPKDQYSEDCAGVRYNAQNELDKYNIDYCSLEVDNIAKQKHLILDQHGPWLPMMADNLIDNHQKVLQLPFSGYVMVGNSYTGLVMLGDRKLSYEDIWKDIRGDELSQLYANKYNFLQVNIKFPGDFWEDNASWKNVIHNFGVVAAVAKDLHFKGIVFDDEPYSFSAYKMVNYKFTEEWFDTGKNNAYRNENYTFKSHTKRLTELFKAIMESMVKAYSGITVLVYHGPYLSHNNAYIDKEDDRYSPRGHPVVVNAGLPRQHEFTGPMFTGLKEGLSGDASLHDMGEAYRYRTDKHFMQAYEWRKHTIALDSTNDLDEELNWIVPTADRATWDRDVQVNFMVYTKGQESKDYSEFDTINKSEVGDIGDALKKAIKYSDEYVVFYSRTLSNEKDGKDLNLNWLSQPDKVDQDWYSMVQEVYDLPEVK